MGAHLALVTADPGLFLLERWYLLVHSSSILIPILELLRLMSDTTSLSILMVHPRILLIWLGRLSERAHHIISGLHTLLRR